ADIVLGQKDGEGGAPEFSTLPDWCLHSMSVWRVLDRYGPNLLHYKTIQEIELQRELEDLVKQISAQLVRGKGGLAEECKALLAGFTQRLGEGESGDQVDAEFRSSLQAILERFAKKGQAELDRSLQARRSKLPESTKEEAKRKLQMPVEYQGELTRYTWTLSLTEAVDRDQLRALKVHFKKTIEKLWEAQASQAIAEEQARQMFKSEWKAFEDKCRERFSRTSKSKKQLAEEVCLVFNHLLRQHRHGDEALHVLELVQASALLSEDTFAWQPDRVARDFLEVRQPAKLAEFAAQRPERQMAPRGSRPSVSSPPDAARSGGQRELLETLVVPELQRHLAPVLSLEIPDGSTQMPSEEQLLAATKRLNEAVQAEENRFLAQLGLRLKGGLVDFLNVLQMGLRRSLLHGLVRAEAQRHEHQWQVLQSHREHTEKEFIEMVQRRTSDTGRAKMLAESFFDSLAREWLDETLVAVAADIRAQCLADMPDASGAAERAYQQAFVERCWEDVMEYVLDVNAYLHKIFSSLFEDRKVAITRIQRPQIASQLGGFFDALCAAAQRWGSREGSKRCKLSGLQTTLRSLAAESRAGAQKESSDAWPLLSERFPVVADFDVEDPVRFTQEFSLQIATLLGEAQVDGLVSERLEAALQKQQAQVWALIKGCSAMCPCCGSKCDRPTVSSNKISLLTVSYTIIGFCDICACPARKTRHMRGEALARQPAAAGADLKQALPQEVQGTKLLTFTILASFGGRGSELLVLRVGSCQRSLPTLQMQVMAPALNFCCAGRNLKPQGEPARRLLPEPPQSLSPLSPTGRSRLAPPALWTLLSRLTALRPLVMLSLTVSGCQSLRLPLHSRQASQTVLLRQKLAAATALCPAMTRSGDARPSQAVRVLGPAVGLVAGSSLAACFSASSSSATSAWVGSTPTRRLDASTKAFLGRAEGQSSGFSRGACDASWSAASGMLAATAAAAVAAVGSRRVPSSSNLAGGRRVQVDPSAPSARRRAGPVFGGQEDPRAESGSYSYDEKSGTVKFSTASASQPTVVFGGQADGRRAPEPATVGLPPLARDESEYAGANPAVGHSAYTTEYPEVYDLKDPKGSFTRVGRQILQEIKSDLPTFYELPQKEVDWVERSLEYNTQGGKMNRGLIVVETGVAMMKHQGREPTNADLHRFAVLGWAVEYLQACMLMADDMMDGSLTRRGAPCWYKLPSVGMLNTNDFLMVEMFVYKLLKRHFGQEKIFPWLVDLFLETTFQTECGQLLDSICANCELEELTTTRWELIVKYKTAFYSFYLPVALAMLVSGVRERAPYDAAREALLLMGVYFQAQDDYLDAFACPEELGKVGTDIQDKKCSWLFAHAYHEHGTPEAKAYLDKNYGKCQVGSEEEQRIKDIYKELGLQELFAKYESDVGLQLDQFKHKVTDAGLPWSVFERFFAMIHKRRK
ncbi:unnamed protein product, partial [Polarella glacialis]